MRFEFIMYMDIDLWLEAFLEKLKELFGERLMFFGIQGSYARGEQTGGSDIDVVVILDRICGDDLTAYRRMLDSLEEKDLVCGFVAGWDELMGWERSDLLQLYLDTRPVFGSFDRIASFTADDIRRAVLSGACALYHTVSHNFLHARDKDMLAGLYKSARFTVRMKHYLESGEYISNMSRLSDMLPDGSDDRRILELASCIDDFDSCSMILLEWAGKIIRTH